jgi:branched-chain amino acid transport system substrate-binding protein
LTDPTGAGQRTQAPAPFNFFYGPSYSDGCRGLVQWAAKDWRDKGAGGSAKFVHMGDNHPYPNAPKEACAAYAKELGFEVLPPIVFSLQPGDFKAQCLTLRESGAHYAYLANTGGSVISLLKSCQTVGVSIQFLANVWGYDENVMDAAGDAADGVVWVVGAARWGDDAPGMALIKEISKISDPGGERARGLHYIRGVCSTMFMKEALDAAQAAGGITGAKVKEAMESRQQWVPKGLDGVCLPSTWTATDHRGTTLVNIYRGTVKGPDKAMAKIYVAELERRPDWLGW